MKIEIVRHQDEAPGVTNVLLVEGDERVLTRLNDENQVIELRVGIGEGPWEAERLARMVTRHALDLNITTMKLDVLDFLDKDPTAGGLNELAKRMARGMVMANYSFSSFLSKRPPTMERVLLVSDQTDLDAYVELGQVIGHAANTARMLSDTPANIMTPVHLEEHAREIAARHGTVGERTVKGAFLERENLSLVIAVGQGSPANPPRLIELTYTGDPKSSVWYVIVGKGVCFDTGGNSMKAPDAMLGMHHDMAGGAAVLEVINALATLEVPVNVVGIVLAVENSVSSEAVRPGDIIQTSVGITVEITNTDAEGRLVLADGLTYAATKRHSIVGIFTIATLTGAAHIALGDGYSGVFSPNADLADQLVRAGNRGFDPLWMLPLSSRYAHYLKSRRADIANACMFAKSGGASSAAWFLQRFAEKLGLSKKWAHLDIAPRMTQEFPDEYLAPGVAMGAGVSLLIEYFLAL